MDEYCVKTSSKNHPEIVHIGDVRSVRYSQGSLEFIDNYYKNDGIYLGKEKVDIDFLIGGSPCQDLSGAKIGGKGLE